jgi:hypothetical protein
MVVESFEPSVTDEIDEPLPGLAERYDALVRKGLDGDALATELRAGALAAGIPLPVGRGLSDVIAFLRRRRSSRRLVEDLGEHAVAIPLLEFHVPPGGAGELKFERGTSDERQFTIKLLGTGLGSGRTLGFSLCESFPERGTCARFIQHVTAHSRLYGVDGGEVETVTDVLRRQVREVVSWNDCPFCGVVPDTVDPVDFILGEDGVDHRHDEHGEERVEELTVTTETSADIGVALSAAAVRVEAGVTARVTAQIACTARWVYPAGRLVIPYRPALAPQALPFWAVA